MGLEEEAKALASPFTPPRHTVFAHFSKTQGPVRG